VRREALRTPQNEGLRGSLRSGPSASLLHRSFAPIGIAEFRSQQNWVLRPGRPEQQPPLV
jgi:hypothetical protein